MYQYESDADVGVKDAPDVATATILEDARKFKTSAESYWSTHFDKGDEDKRFVTVKGEQWLPQARLQKEKDNEPCLEFNISNAFAQQQINMQRQNRPSAVVKPVDDNADENTARIIQGLVKNTEVTSDFESVIDTAAENAVLSGLGFYRLVTEYESPKSFDQVPRFLPIYNSEAVLIDPLSRALDGSDMMKAQIVEWIAEDVAMAQYGKDVTSYNDCSTDTGWYNTSEKTICIAEYWWIDIKVEKLYKLGNKTFWSDEISDEDRAIAESRDSSRKTVRWAKLSGSKVLEQGTFAGEHIPIFPVFGRVVWIKNERHINSFIHYAKDAAMMFNLWKSLEAQSLIDHSDAPWLASVGSIDGLKEHWDNPKGARVLPFNALDPQTREQLPMPQRLASPAPPSGMINAANEAQMIVGDILNMHAPTMGANVNQQSGVAIRGLQSQGETAQFHFSDNLNKTIRHSTSVLLEVFKSVYNSQKILRILGIDGTPEMVEVNKPQTADESVKAHENGKDPYALINAIGVGQYDVVMDTGASYNTLREQTFEQMTELMRNNPNLMQVFGDLWLKDAPLLNAKGMSERLKRSIPPEITSDGADQEVTPEVKQMQAQMQQMQQALQQAQAALTDKQADRLHEMQLKEMDIHAKLHIADTNNDTKKDVVELQAAVTMLMQQMQIPPALANAVNEDLNEPEPPDQYQQKEPAQDAGFFMPEQSQAQPQIPQQQPQQTDEDQT